MSDYARWRAWGDPAGAGAFPRLWRVLGAAYALDHTDAAPTAQVVGIESATRRAQELAWTFPPYDAASSAKLRNNSPQAWLEAWDAAIGDRLDRAPVRVAGWREQPAPAEWIDALRHAAPGTVATLRLRSGEARASDWPMRIHALQAGDRAVIDATLAMWPASRLARRGDPCGEGFDCDVLVHSGSAASLLDGLRTVPAARAMLLVLAVPAEGIGEGDDGLAALMQATRASGFIVAATGPGFDLADGINRFAEELSHARRLDVAACLGFALAPRLVVGLSDGLARFTILEVAQQVFERSRRIDAVAPLPPAMRGDIDAALARVPLPPAMAEPPSTPGSAPADSALEPVGGQGGLESLGRGEDAAAAEPPTSAAPDEYPDYARPAPGFEYESAGASELVAAAEALRRAEASVSADRYLQQQSFVERDGRREPAMGGFVVDHGALVHVRIGPPDRAWDAAAETFPVHALPDEEVGWDLQVWLSEQVHLPVPIEGEIHLGRFGASSTCEFRFTPRRAGTFNGRLSVLHRGRVIQTAALGARVRSADAAVDVAATPKLGRIARVRQDLADLRRRRRFDLAFVLNHAGTAQPVAHALGERRAWLINLRQVEQTVQRLNAALSTLAKTVADYAGGLESAKGRELLLRLARIGDTLHLYIVEALGQALGERAGATLEMEYIQVVSTHSDAIVVPFEFVYEYGTPDPDASLCPEWRTALQAGRCPATCAHGAKTVCPMGFWGLRKVIERHAVAPQLAAQGEVGVQSEPVTGRDTLKVAGSAVYACSTRVKDEQLEPMRQRMLAAQLAAEQAIDWDDWARRVAQHGPALLIALAHSDGAEETATLEVGGKPIWVTGITKGHIRSANGGADGPLVALLGCDMAGTGDAFANPVAVFSLRGAAAVVGTIATVYAEHSANTAARLVQGLTFADRTQTRRLGETLRELKRNALLDGELMPLCLVTFGDADWLLSN